MGSEMCIRDSVNIKHTSASPVGSTITCECELAQIDGRKLIFNVIAHDDFGPVGEGVHERFVINNDKFMSKVAEKQAALQMHSAE